MKTIGERKIWSFHGEKDKAAPIKSPTVVRNASGHAVRTYMELATKVAELQFRNPDFVLMFRGQDGDHRNNSKNSSLKPTMFRADSNGNGLREHGELEARFQNLERAEKLLVTSYRAAKLLGQSPLERHRILRWAILQHYEVCRTPLLDVTHSLRVAASFASLNAQNEAFLYVLAVPNLSGGVTASAEAGLQIVRLASVCPPAAVRPHIQEGYLLGEYPEMVNQFQKEHYEHYEIDFGRRLIAKFRFNPADFWKRGVFPRISKAALYPGSRQDPLQKIAATLKKALAE
jgi:hypothetical protein